MYKLRPWSHGLAKWPGSSLSRDIEGVFHGRHRKPLEIFTSFAPQDMREEEQESTECMPTKHWLILDNIPVDLAVDVVKAILGAEACVWDVSQGINYACDKLEWIGEVLAI